MNGENYLREVEPPILLSMKNILILFICVILCGCSYPPLQEPSPTQSPPQIFTPTS